MKTIIKVFMFKKTFLKAAVNSNLYSPQPLFYE
jgi:hypothetical protein